MRRIRLTGRLLLVLLMLATVAIYAPGLGGGWLFDDYPNIVDNKGVQPDSASLADLTRAALSSPSSRFKRPLASLSFAFNYLAGGLDPFGWKVVNLVIHLLNGLLVFLLAWRLLQAPGGGGPQRWSVTGAVAKVDPAAPRRMTEKDGRRPREMPASVGLDSARSDTISRHPARASAASEVAGSTAPQTATCKTTRDTGPGVLAALVAGAWLLLPINLTGVLYVVQRMESLANLFVLLGLWGYVAARQRMLAGRGGWWLCAGSLVVCTALGLTAKETAVMLPLYGFLIEWLVFGFRAPPVGAAHGRDRIPEHGDRAHGALLQQGLALPVGAARGRDWRLHGLFAIVLWVPLVLGLLWRLPAALDPGTWARRDFTLVTRLLSEARIVVDYIGWTLMPLPQWLSFYHDDFVVSRGLLQPWTTLASMLAIAALLALGWWLRRRLPLVALGIALFFGCHLLTATILPLELIYEHRNYFASFGLMLAVVPLLARAGTWPLARRATLAALAMWWIALTGFTAYNWGTPLRLAADLAARAPESPRALYEYGRTLLVLGNYNPQSVFTKRAYEPLEKATALPRASILPLQALLFRNVRMHKPVDEAWWDQLIAKLRARTLGVQDESSLAAMAQCAVKGSCQFDRQRMLAAFEAALSHTGTHARVYAAYADYAWNVLRDQALGYRLIEEAVRRKPSEPVYHITLARMATVLHRPEVVAGQIKALEKLNYGGRLDQRIAELRGLLDGSGG